MTGIDEIDVQKKKKYWSDEIINLSDRHGVGGVLVGTKRAKRSRLHVKLADFIGTFDEAPLLLRLRLIGSDRADRQVRPRLAQKLNKASNNTGVFGSSHRSSDSTDPLLQQQQHDAEQSRTEENTERTNHGRLARQQQPAGSVDVTLDRIVPVRLHGDKRATGNQPLLAPSDLSPTVI
ncbi:hypothetical protein WH47_09997 [Habropoda laboriosa]|uniref:Uncharacterized protein n=1 Tax=Habropoda laboriosa TaxID=597456 RepID=A0A0L7R3K7_9HYME|nr:hypothetical protein WH47_09997 [Habropoda laboriosa]